MFAVVDEINFFNLYCGTQKGGVIFIQVCEQLNAGLRAIDWERGNPYVWKMEDLQYLLETEHLFARKFDSQNMDVVIKIRELFS